MPESILVLGRSNTGKSSSIRNLDPNITFVINCDKKSLPFKGSKKNYPEHIEPQKWGKKNHIFEDRFSEILNKFRPDPGLEKDGRKFSPISQIKERVIIIDTISYAMVRSVMDYKDVDDWGKYLTFADQVWELIKCATYLRDDQYLIIMAHTEVEEGTEQFKIPAGKFTREKLTPDAKFRVVLFSDFFIFEDGTREHFFWTQPAWKNTCRTPIGMFNEPRIDNDLNYVLKCIAAYDNEKEQPEGVKLKVNETNVVMEEIKGDGSKTTTNPKF